MSTVHIFDPDQALVKSLSGASREKREAALRTLMERHGPSLHRTATRMLGDPAAAEDVVQETFLKAWTKAANFQAGRAKFSTWLQRVCVNACLDRLRKRAPVLGLEMDDVRDERAGSEQILLRQEESERVRAAILALPERQRAAISLSVYEAVSQAEGAEILEMSEGAYESLLVRARRALRQTLKERANVGA